MKILKITYDNEKDSHEIDCKNSLILSKNAVGLEINNLKNFEFRNIDFAGQWGSFGKIKQMINAFMFIYGLGRYKGDKNNV